MSSKSHRRALSVFAAGLVFSVSVAGTADARRGGSFGSRGARTYSAPPSTLTAPQAVGPVQRSMTAPGQAGAYQPGFQRPITASPAYRPQGSFMQRWGGPIMGGLLGAGLVGMLMGHGFGGGGFGAGGGMLSLLLQIGLIALLAMLAMRFFRRGAGPSAYATPFSAPPEPFGMAPPQSMFQPAQSAPPPQSKWAGDEVGLTQADFDAFERLLIEVQDAFGREDYAALRERTTPEIMSYLSEELSQNAVAGRRNEVRGTKLVSGDLAEAWSEDGGDYASVAMRYSSIDLMRDRAGGQVVSGVETPTETTEVWTFVRPRGGPWGGGGGVWKLSAIQETGA
jgi:predicted lipid-binding transport protein (Tim44 family)